MGRFFATFTLAFAFGLGPVAMGQQGGFGGGAQAGLGGFQGGNQGQFQRQMLNGSTQSIDQAILGYLNGEEIRSILTPGEFVEWTLKLKAGQVVIGEARSEAFDPALEIVDDKNKVLASNDDRYPGDQRPLLLWRCERDGDYKLHARCFRNKSGGVVFVRFKTYDSVDLSSAEKVEKELDAGAQFLLRIPMKVGQVKELVSESGGAHRYMGIRADEIIAPNGLPDINLIASIQPANRNTMLMAPVAGDYYALATPFGGGGERGTIHAWTREIEPAKLIKDGSGYASAAPANSTWIWEISVKSGEFLEAATPDLDVNSRLVVAEAPDVSKFHGAEPENNPFFPLPNPKPSEPAFDIFSKRARDGRITAFRVRRDARLWVASNGLIRKSGDFHLIIKPAAAVFAEAEPNAGKLRISDTDYWAFDAKAGDVMTLNSSSAGFSEMILVRDPDLTEIRHYEAALDQMSDDWRMVVQKPGRYLVAVSCLGNGGGGEYSLSRKVFHAKEFGRSAPAKGEISNGEIQIWKFTATPNDPLLIHWSSTNWSYDIAVYDEKGERTDFQRDAVDAHNLFGILTTPRPQTYVVVLTGGRDRATYSIELNGIPGYKPAAAGAAGHS